jgi:hypothetical protein
MRRKPVATALDYVVQLTNRRSGKGIKIEVAREK